MQRTSVVFGLLALVLSGPTAGAGNKVQVCHIPPGDPANFHTITISENALTAHLGHGDLPGRCFENAEILCDDVDACTIDGMDATTETCLVDHPPVDCTDGLLCTTDGCDPTSGCQYAPIVCDDGDLCTVDQCNPYDGQCIATPIDCGPLGICLTDTGECDYPCDGITCDPIDQCHAQGICVLPGECIDGAPLSDGTPCDDGDATTIDDQCTAGICAGTPEATCPCWTLEELNSLRYPVPEDQVQICRFDLDNPNDPQNPDFGIDDWEIRRIDFSYPGYRAYLTRVTTAEYLASTGHGWCFMYDECNECGTGLRFNRTDNQLTPEEHAICKAQMRQAAIDRGLPCPAQ